MHDIKWIREHPDELDGALARRGLPAEAKRLIEMDRRRRAAVQQVEAALARRNLASKEIGAASGATKRRPLNRSWPKSGLKAEIPGLEAEEKRISRELEKALAEIPNLPLHDVPDGKDSADNVERHRFGAKPISHSRRDSISISAKRSGRWISRLPQSSLAHVLWC